MERDDASVYVLESVILSLVLLGAAFAVQSLQDTSLPNARPRAELQRIAEDAMSVLAGLEDTAGARLLDQYVAEAVHCSLSTSPPAADCDGARSRSLSVKLEHYLPVGAGYAIGVGNGAATRELYHSPLPRGESVASSHVIAPDWNLTFVVNDLSCYEAGTDAGVTLIPIDRGALAYSRYGNVTVGAAETTGVASATPRWWDVTLAGGTRPPAGVVTAKIVANDTHPGSAAYTPCLLGGRTGDLRAAIAGAPFSASANSAPVGREIGFTADLTGILAVPGATVGNANVTVFAPLAPRGTHEDGYLAVDRVALGGGALRTGTWNIRADSFYGAHLALLRVPVTIGAVEVELRKPLLVHVALPTGEIPIDPMYRVALQAWLPDWG